ncbi:hypothetical protein BH24PSE2_BH24PSE2_07620 [soil metagenome]
MRSDRFMSEAGHAVVLLMLAAIHPALAQEDDDAPFLRAGYTLGESATLGPRDAGVRSREYDLDVRFGSFAAAGGAVSAGLDYRYTRYEFHGLETRDWDLHRLRLPVVWRQARQDHEAIAMLAPGVATSSNRFQEPRDYARDDLDLAAGFAIVKRASPAVRWTAGVLYDRRFGRPALYPTAGVILRRDAWTLRLVAPDPRFTWSPDTRLRWFAFIEPAGQQWHALNAAANRRFDFRARAWRAAVGAEFQVLERVAVRIHAGREFARRFELVDNRGQHVDESAADAAFAGLSVAFSGERR